MKRIVCLGLAAALLTTGCALFPEEEELRKAPVVQTLDEEYFQTAEVATGDIVDYVSEKCTYQCQAIENLSFGVGREPLEATYVKVGDTVKAGQVLAKLSLGSLEEEVTEKEKICADYEQQIAYQEGLQAIEEERKKLAKRYGKDYDESRLESITKTVQDLKDKKYIEEIKLGEIYDNLKGRRLVAGIDGEVTFVKELGPWDGIRANETFITIQSKEYGFLFSSASAELYQIGNVYTVETDQGSYECEIIRIRENKQKKDYVDVTLVPLNEDVEIALYTSGMLKVVKGEVKNVTYIPTGALRIIDEKPAVYVINEQGLRDIRYVEIGISVSGKLTAEDNRTEIKSGLKPGEQVIIKTNNQ